MSVMPRLLGRGTADSADEVVLAPMRKRHLKQAMPIETAAYRASWSRGVFESELEQIVSGSRHYLVALHRKRVIGYAGVWIVPDVDGAQAHVTNVVVAPAHRRRGIGIRMMLALADEVIRRGCVAWTLEVRATSEGAQAMYRRLGFAPAGVRKGYYDNSEDAIVMWCHDIDTPAYRDRLKELAA